MSDIILILLGFVVGIFSGLVGIGGGLLIIPALLFVYPLLSGLPSMGIKLATGVSAVQGLAGSLSSVWIHHGKGNAHWRVIFFLSMTTMTGSYLGGVTSVRYSPQSLTWIYVVVLGLILAFSIYNRKLKAKKLLNGNGELVELVEPDLSTIPHKWLSLFLALGIGYLSGLMGIGGAVLLIPLMCDLMRLPIRLAIGSSSGIILLTSIATVVGKAQGNLIPVKEAILIAIGAVLGGYIGAKLSQKLSERFLFWLLMTIITLTLVRMILSL